MASVQWYADCIRNGDDPEVVLQVAIRDTEARLAANAVRLFANSYRPEHGDIVECGEVRAREYENANVHD